jgi:hypothetical protein
MNNRYRLSLSSQFSRDLFSMFNIDSEYGDRFLASRSLQGD